MPRAREGKETWLATQGPSLGTAPGGAKTPSFLLIRAQSPLSSLSGSGLGPAALQWIETASVPLPESL